MLVNFVQLRYVRLSVEVRPTALPLVSEQLPPFFQPDVTLNERRMAYFSQ
jgi:hypothetical protein